jgi:hypothetical protein
MHCVIIEQKSETTHISYRARFARASIPMSHTYSLCQYCHSPLQQDGGWQTCSTCQVDYYQHDTDGLHIKWWRDIGHLSIALNLFPEANKTLLWVYDQSHNYVDDPKAVTQIEIPYCVQNVTPENCLDKIKLLLTFQ